ncbi:MAG: hypothetical protein AAB472_00730 [Patescibacteria group bacterium]
MINRLLPVIVLIIAIAIFVGYTNPLYTREILPLQAQVREYDGALAAAADFNRKEAQLATERAAIPAESIQKIETFLPDGVDNVQLILDLNALAARSGVQLSNFDVKENGVVAQNEPQSGGIALEQGGKQTDSLDLSVKATASYSAFRTFLAGAEQSLRILDVTQLDVSDSPTGVYSYAITFRIYWLH